jgi:DNA helicase II / ATP-dependent DNA helicase PcrA
VAVLKPIATLPTFQPDERQREAIEHLHGPVLVVAGAGTGKTTVLTQRIARLIRESHARPDEILAVTYTENAAREIRERVQSELRGSNSAKLQATTFHAYCNELLIRNGKQFGVLDEKDLWIYLRRRLHELHLQYFVRAANVGQFLTDLLSFISHCHDELVTPEKYADYVGRLERGKVPVPRIGSSKNPLPDSEVLERCREISSVFTTVERMLQAENLGTFGHMITRAYSLLLQDADLRVQEQKSARFILVDEFQDANFAQVKLLQTIAGDVQNVFAVGDPDQAVYRFRGASSAAFGLFQRSFPAAKLVVLGKNRRSNTAILNSAFSVIDKNPNAAIVAAGLQYKRSPLISARDEENFQPGKSEFVESVTLAARDLESLDLVETLRERKKRPGTKWSDLAVLYRIHFHCEQVAAELAEKEIPFFIENMNVLDTTEARDLFACAGAVVSSADAASLFRVSALPQWNIDPAKFRALIRALPREGPPTGMFSALEQVEGGAAATATILAVRQQIEETKASAHTAFCLIAQKFGIDRSSPAITAILEFVKSWEGKPVTKTQTLGEFLEYLQYFRDAGGAVCASPSQEDAVRLMTVHAAKGLEWKHVFIIRAFSGCFPGYFRETLVEFPPELLDPDSVAESDDKELFAQEERRLFYVAMTRARDTLTMYAKEGSGKIDKTPPGYLRELIKDKMLRPWFRERKPRQVQTDLFAVGQPAHSHARMAPWLLLPPFDDLSSRLSASAVQTYQTCPLQFKLAREWRVPSEIGGALQYGGAIHRVLKTYFDAVRYQREIPDIIAQFKEALIGIQDRYQYALYLAQGIQQLTDFLNNREGKTHPEVLHTEEWFEVRMGDVTLTGRIDRMDRTNDGRVVVTDYKTGKPRAQDDADESLQLSIYALAVKDKWGYEVERLVFHNIEEDAPVSTYRNAAQLDEARLVIEDVAQKISEGRFEAKLGFHCTFCSYRSLCPATEKRSFKIATAKKAAQKT